MFGEHASFIVPAYLISAASLGAITLFIVSTYRARKRELEKLETAGMSRRSSGER